MQTIGVIGEQAIEYLDLSLIKQKLMKKDEGLGWSQQVADAAEREYKRFLLLNLRHPDKSIVPDGIVDEMWHAHLLDTRKYAEDCDTIFGHFLHHFPYFGLRGASDAAQLVESFEATKTLYASMFGEAPPVGGGCRTCLPDDGGYGRTTTKPDCASNCSQSPPDCTSPAKP